MASGTDPSEERGHTLTPAERGTRLPLLRSVSGGVWAAAVRAAIPVLLVAVAAVVRVPYLWDIPRFTDEVNEAFSALLIAHGRTLPLTNVDPYIGPLWNYMLAAAFVLVGPSLYSPRAIAGGLGILTIVPTYLLGYSLGGRGVGVLAAAFLALSPVHIVVNSHIGWSNCITPLFTTLAFWLLQRAIAADDPRQLPWAGIAWGLALQTHPTVALFLPGIGLYGVLARRSWWGSGWPWLAALLALIACFPLVLANVLSGFAGLKAGLHVQAQYSAGEVLGLDAYRRRLGAEVSLLSDGFSGVLAEFGPLRGPLDDPLGLTFWVLVVLGLGQGVRRGWHLPVAALGAYIVLLPVVNARFESIIPKARYVAPLLPLCYAAIGLLIVTVYRLVGRVTDRQALFCHDASPVSPGSRAALLAVAARATIGVGVLGLLLTPLSGLYTYYRQDVERGRTNAMLYETIAALNAARTPGERVYVDRALLLAFTPGGGQLFDQLRFAGSVYSWNRQAVDLSKNPDEPPALTRGLLVVADTNASIAAASLQLQDVDSGHAEHAPARVFRVLGPALSVVGGPTR